LGMCGFVMGEPPLACQLEVQDNGIKHHISPEVEESQVRSLKEKTPYLRGAHVSKTFHHWGDATGGCAKGRKRSDRTLVGGGGLERGLLSEVTRGKKTDPVLGGGET